MGAKRRFEAKPERWDVQSNQRMNTTANTFQRLCIEVAATDRIAYPLAELNDLLASSSAGELSQLPMPQIQDAYRLNYVTAMVEVAAHRGGVPPPEWTQSIAPLEEPVFIDPSLLLRAHLLTASPPPFRRRNIFIDSTIGDRV